MKSWYDERGQALALVLILSMVLFIAGTAAVAAALQHSRLVTLEEAREKAYYIAEAGVERAVAELRQMMIYFDPNNLPLSNEPNGEKTVVWQQDLGGGMIAEAKVKLWEVKRDDKGYVERVRYRITSQGSYPRNPAPGQLYAQQTIEAEVEVRPDPFLAYGGPGLKSDTAVHLTGGVTSTGGSLLARTGDVESQAPIAGNVGGIYAGRNAYLQGGITSGGGEIKAGRDVHLSGILSTWSGEIWAGGEVYGPWWQLGEVTIYEHCGTNIPGFPLPKFPVVDKGSPWYSQVKSEAIDQGQFFNSAEEFLSHPDKGVSWKYDVFVWPLINSVTVTVWGAELNLSGLYVVNGPMDFNQAYRRAYQIWQQRIRDQYPGKQVIFIDVSLGRLAVKAAQPVTIVADSINLDGGILGFGGVDTSGIMSPFGLFAVNGDVVYKAFLGTGGRLSVMATGKFECNTSFLGTRSIDLDWVAAKDDVLINALVNLNAAQAVVPPGTPVGYQIVSWSVK